MTRPLGRGCKAVGVHGIGQYTPEGFVVLKGSRARMKNVDSIVGAADERFGSGVFATAKVDQMVQVLSEIKLKAAA